MKNKDIIQNFIFEDANVRGVILRINDSFQTITQQHPYPTSIRKILGEMLVASGLMSSIIKFKGRLSVQFQGKNPLKLLLAQCNHEFHLRGLAQWQGENFSENDLLIALKKGVLAIIVSSDTTTQPYQGVVAWQGESLAQSIEAYFKDSEQLPTRLWLTTNETSAVGLLLQPIPKEGSKKTKAVVTDNDWEHIIHLTETISAEELLNLDNETLLNRLYVEDEVRLFQPLEVKFQCTCSMQRSENAILLLGREEAEQELKDKQKIAVTCEFCNKEYIFDRVDVANIFKKEDKSSANLH